MDTDSARMQPPIDTTIHCLGGQHEDLRVVPGGSRILLCVMCGEWVFPRTPLVIAGPDLVVVIKTMAELWEELLEIDNLSELEDDPNIAPYSGDPTFAELYEAKVAKLAYDIGEIRIEGDG